MKPKLEEKKSLKDSYSKSGIKGSKDRERLKDGQKESEKP